jgi:hypothetical protein
MEKARDSYVDYSLMNSYVIQITYVSIVRCSSTTHLLHPNFFPLCFANIVCYGKHIAYPANFHFSSLSHIQLTLTRMHQAQENIKRVKRKSNGLWQFECGWSKEKVW